MNGQTIEKSEKYRILAHGSDYLVTVQREGNRPLRGYKEHDLDIINADRPLAHPLIPRSSFNYALHGRVSNQTFYRMYL